MRVEIEQDVSVFWCRRTGRSEGWSTAEQLFGGIAKQTKWDINWHSRREEQLKDVENDCKILRVNAIDSQHDGSIGSVRA